MIIISVAITPRGKHSHLFHRKKPAQKCQSIKTSFEAYFSHSHISKLHNSIHDGLIEDCNLLPTSKDFLEKVFIPKLLYLGYFKP